MNAWNIIYYPIGEKPEFSSRLQQLLADIKFVSPIRSTAVVVYEGKENDCKT